MKLYTTPIVCKGKREWFVFFRYWDNQQKKYIQKKIASAAGLDLNRIKDLREREAEFKVLREAREDWLKMGWNPLTDSEFKNRPVVIDNLCLKDIKEWDIAAAFEHALKYKKLAKRSKPEYKKSVDYFLKAAKVLGLKDTSIKDLTRTYIKAIFSQLLLPPFSLSNKNYNKRLCHIKSLLTDLEEWKAIDMNPAFRIKDLREEQTEKFVPLTNEEKEMIKEYLYLVDYPFFVFCMTLYYTGVRPDELLTIKIKDYKNSELHLQPFSQSSKTNKERHVVINEKLANFLTRHIENDKDEMYIFSEDFKRGKKRINQRSATYKWNKYVRKELGINKYLYCLKHTGADDLIKAGANEEDVQVHLGHSSRFMTQRYTKLGIEKSKEVIRKVKVEF